MYEYLVQVEGTTPSLGGGDVTDYVDDYTAASFNAVRDALRKALRSPTFGDGRHGRLRLGAISDPTAGNVPTLQLAGSGPITATVKYRYRFGNVSGVTLATNASASIVATGNAVRVHVPAQASDANVGYCAVERTHDNGSTWFHIATVPISDATQAFDFIDSNPITSGTNLGASNTTTTTGTLGGGDWQFVGSAEGSDVATAQTLTYSSDNTQGLGGVHTLRFTSAINFAGNFNGVGKFLRKTWPWYHALSISTSYYSLGPSTIDVPNTASDVFANGPNSNAVYGDNWLAGRRMHGSGGNGVNANGSGAAGVQLEIFANGKITFSGTWTLSGGAGAATTSGQSGNGGGAGPWCLLHSPVGIDTSAATFNLVGGAGSNATGDGGGGSALGGGGGGCGGTFIKIAPYIKTGTESLTGGVGGNQATNNSTSRQGGPGGNASGLGGRGINATGDTGATGKSFNIYSATLPYAA
jgi:hypothetical protein